MKTELFQKKFNTSGDMRMLSDFLLIYMVSRNSTQLLNINSTKFQVDREPVYLYAVRLAPTWQYFGTITCGEHSWKYEVVH